VNVLTNAAYALLLFAIGTFLTATLDTAIRERVWHPKRLVQNISQLVDALLRSDPGHKRIDRVLFFGAAPLAVAAVSVALLVVPVGNWGLAGPSLKVGVFFYLVVLDFLAVALLMAGWGANHKFGTEGAFAVVAQLVSYVVPLGFAVTGAVMAAQSLAATAAVQAQKGLWFGLWQPLGLAIYLVATFGQTFRPPADLPLSEDSNVLIEHHGAGEALLRIALYGIWFSAAAMGATLFLGGWRGPWLPGPLWFVVKTAALLALMSWAGKRYRRLTLKQMLRGAWLILIPASIVNVIIVGLILMVKR